MQINDYKSPQKLETSTLRDGAQFLFFHIHTIGRVHILNFQSFFRSNSTFGTLYKQLVTCQVTTAAQLHIKLKVEG